MTTPLGLFFTGIDRLSALAASYRQKTSAAQKLGERPLADFIVKPPNTACGPGSSLFGIRVIASPPIQRSPDGSLPPGPGFAAQGQPGKTAVVILSAAHILAANYTERVRP